MSSKETDQLQDVQHRVQLAETLFTEQGEYIRSIVRFVVSGSEYTEDLIHDLFLFFVARPIPDDVVNLRGYLYKVVLDKIRDWQRSQFRYKVKIRDYGLVKSKQDAEIFQEGRLSENAQQLMTLVEKHLSKKEVRAIILRYQNQYEIEDVAREMNIKPRSVSRYISVGLKKIRKVLNIEQGAEHEEGE